MKKEFENNLLENTYESKNHLVRVYFRLKAAIAIRMANLSPKDIILDFGCGAGWLERKLKDFKIYGYDINPEKTFIKDYRSISPTKIFALDVFEHMPLQEIEKVLNNFKKQSNKFELIVSIPTENWLSRKVRKLVGKPEVPKEHITRHKDILHLLKKHFRMKKKFNFLTVTHTFVFLYRRV